MSSFSQFNTSIKSVQRGVASGAQLGNSWTINISSINPAKSIVLLTGGYVLGGATYAQANQPYVTSLTSSQIVGTGGSLYINSSWSSSQFSWQVVEFY